MKIKRHIYCISIQIYYKYIKVISLNICYIYCTYMLYGCIYKYNICFIYNKYSKIQFCCYLEK